MKLVRLTTTTEDGKFDNIFDDEIILEPNSKIALQSVSINTDITDITIDAANEEVEFEITSGNTRTITFNLLLVLVQMIKYKFQLLIVNIPILPPI